MIFKNNIYVFLISVFLFTCCESKTDKQGSFSSRIKFKQYYINGKKLYQIHCSNCHQKDGSGLVRLYPPINNADYFKADPNRTICIIRNGLNGEIFVNGISFNQPMPENTHLSNLEIAELLTFLYGNWGDQEKLVKPEEIANILKRCPPSLSK